MSPISHIFLNLQEKIQRWRIAVNAVLHGKAVGIKTSSDIFKYGCQNIQMQKWLDIFTSIDL